jgi:PAS domain S-box-containing protein
MPTDEFLRNDAFLSKELLRLALASSDIGVWRVDPRTRLVDLTASTKEIFGLPLDQPVDYAAFLGVVHPDDRPRTRTELGRALDPAGDGQCEVEFRVVTANGGTRWLFARGSAFFETKADARQPKLFIGTLRDVTEAKAADARQQAAIEQQQTLLLEVNHRVKNSLQLVSSLLRLQSRRISDKKTRRQLEDTTTRISTIARIHERLYRDKEYNRINFGALLADVCAELQGAAPHCPVLVHAKNIMVTADRAVPLALIVNELVTNTFKYAYPDGGGPVSVTVSQVEDSGGLRIDVEDYGTGLPADFSPERPSTLGMTLIGSLTAQLGGRLDILKREGGACFSVSVPSAERS